MQQQFWKSSYSSKRWRHKNKHSTEAEAEAVAVAVAYAQDIFFLLCIQKLTHYNYCISLSTIEITAGIEHEI